MGNIGPGELLIIALIALLIFGAGRIADIGKGLGQGIKNFKQGLKDGEGDKAEDEPAAKADAKDPGAKKKRVVVETTEAGDEADDEVPAKKKS
jgi:sec-independent protein translocase protein TatA